MPDTVYSTVEHLKSWSERFWSKKETGDSWWDGYFRKSLYHYDIQDFNAAETTRTYTKYVTSTGSIDTHRRMWQTSSDFGVGWFDFDLTKAFRCDVEGVPHPTLGLIHEKRTLAHAKAAEVEDDKYWQTDTYDKTYTLTTPSQRFVLKMYPQRFPGLVFGWMYRVMLQRFFMERSIEHYDVTKGLTPDWPIPEDDVVWVNDRENTKQPTIPYPKVKKPEEPPDEEIPGGDAPEAVPSIAESIKQPVIQPVEPAPQPIHDFGAKFLIPLITLAEEDALKIRESLKVCIENGRKLEDEKRKLCTQYNEIVAERINEGVKRYTAETQLLETNVEEEMNTLYNLYKRVNTNRTRDINIPLADNQKKAVLDMIKDLKERCKRLSRN